MLTQEPTPAPKCKLDISSFLIHPHPFDGFICAKDEIDYCVVTANDGKVGGG